MAKAMSVSPWWKTSSESAKPHAACAASLKAALKRCTTWFLSPTGGRHDPEMRTSGFRNRVMSNQVSSAGFFVMVAPLKVGIAGLGTVGAEVVRLIEEQAR